LRRHNVSTLVALSSLLLTVELTVNALLIAWRMQA
jgi:hypothetical protein